MFGVNPYSPYGYVPPYGGQNFSGAQNNQNFAQTYQNGMPFSVPQQPSQTSGPDWMQVAEIKQVEQIQVQPGGKAWVMVQNEPVFALRVADQMGLVTTSYYRFEKIDPESMTANNTTTEYVTREEFQNFVNSLQINSQTSVKGYGKK